MSRRVPVSEMASTEQLAQLLHKDRAQLERLTAENAALKVELGRHPSRLLTRIAAALQLAELSSDPMQGFTLDGDKVSSSQTHPTPGASTEAARKAARRLHWGLTRALNDFDQAAEHAWYPPRPPGEPKVWCRNSTCSAREKRIPKYVGPKGTRIEMAFCQVCNGKLSDA